MFSQGLSSLKNAASTETRLTCRRTSSASATTSQPNTSARPASGVSNVPRIRMSVDLPLPLGPRMPVTPPLSTVRSSSWRATLSFHSRFHQCAPDSRSRRRKALRTPRSSTAGLFITNSKNPNRQKEKDRGGAQQPHGPDLTVWVLVLGYESRVNRRLRAGMLRPCLRGACEQFLPSQPLLTRLYGHTRMGVQQSTKTNRRRTRSQDQGGSGRRPSRTPLPATSRSGRTGPYDRRPSGS